MAKLYVTEHPHLTIYQGNMLPAVPMPPLVEQTPVVIGAGSLSSAAFGVNTRVVGLHADAICSVAFGVSPTATANSRRMAANSTEYFQVNPGDKVAVITNT